ncbi:tetratricopeptide repeat protein 17 [Battus philenor]|uniref:tetratricopeptide repeat protein 17 n=1 Tax=Battus philenor TaxID=42288 RepID=UPI0035D02B4B
MKGIILLCFFIVCTIHSIQGNTHWMVTESGLIQPRVDSPFELARPYDLLAFLNQETYWNDVFNIYNDLSKRQTLIDELWDDVDKNTDIGVQVLSDNNCLKAGQLNQLDWYVSLSDDGSSRNIPENDYKLARPLFRMDVDVPDCKKISSLIFSMSTFEHLEAMVHRENVTISPELYLPEKISPIMTIEQFGHWLSGILRKNSSSWLHYNLASLYWRVRGNAPKAIECSRRAIHYAPRAYKDIALLGLGTILHLGKMAEDAVVILNAAVDHNPNSYLSHFHLGNAYAVLCDFNSSSNHLDQCIKLNPNFDVAVKHKHGAVCLANIWKKLLVVKVALNKLRNELLIYGEKEAQLLKSQSSILKVMKHDEEYDYRSVVKNCEKMTELTGLDIKGLKLKGDKNSLLKYFLEGSLYSDLWSDKTSLQAVESAYSLQRLVRHIEKHSDLASEIVLQSDLLRAAEEKVFKDHITPSPLPEILISKPRVDVKSETKPDKKPSNQIEENIKEFEKGVHLFPLTMKINRNSEDFDKDPDWPSNSFCKEAAPNFPENLEAIFPVFLSFENKGLMLGSLLTEKLGVSASEEYELPWHPPTCPQDKAAAAFTQKKSQKNQLVGEVVKLEYLKQKLLEYVGNGNVDLVKHMQDAEIGQRIYAAVQKKLAPKWILYTLSSLYWRARGNNGNALYCLLTANKSVPHRYKDIVLVSLASVCLEMGYFDEALTAAEEAFRISLYEPATNFILAELNLLKKHRNTHMFHLKQVVRVDKDFLGGTAKNLLYGWACILKQVNVLTEMDYNTAGDVCTQLEPGVNMVCEKDGSNCHMTNVKCSNNKEKMDTSTIVRLLELKDESIQKSQADNMDESIFDPFVANMPRDRGDFLGHQVNFDSMMFTITNSLKGCGPVGCRNLQAEDLSLKEEDCGYHHLQLGYWLHIVSFKQPFADTNLRLPTEIVTMTPSNKKVPECRLTADSSRDFFLERVVRVDPEGWEPVLSLMHQFAEMFSYFDYVTLGAKIAKYVETKPRSWLGALSAGWWCGAGGRGACAVRCLSAALALAPHHHAAHVMRALVALLHTQSKQRDAKDIAYLSFYLTPKSKVEAFLVAVSHTCMAEYEQAVWMYRYALTYDSKFLPAKACLHATMCLMFYGDNNKGQSMEE